MGGECLERYTLPFGVEGVLMFPCLYGGTRLLLMCAFLHGSEMSWIGPQDLLLVQILNFPYVPLKFLDRIYC